MFKKSRTKKFSYVSIKILRGLATAGGRFFDNYFKMADVIDVKFQNLTLPKNHSCFYTKEKVKAENL